MKFKLPAAILNIYSSENRFPPCFRKMTEEMEDLDTSRDTCEQTSRSNQLCTDIREISQTVSNVRKSLQTCGLVNNREVLEGPEVKL